MKKILVRKSTQNRFVPSTNAKNPFVSAMEVSSNFTLTENGALTNKSTLNDVLDWFGSGGALRQRSADDVIKIFSKAFAQDRLLALKVLFYLRDVREGQGERNTFRICLKWLADNYPNVFRQNIEHIPFYGRYDDLNVLIGTPLEKDVYALVSEQLKSDIKNMKKKESISLLGKWLPSINTSNKEVVKLAYKYCKALDFTPKKYRKLLSALRKYIDVLEVKMCNQDWTDIDFEKVPSKASLNYRKAFGRHDQERYAAYLASVEKGEAKINAGAIFPYEIFRSLVSYSVTPQEITQADLQWKAMPNWLKGNDLKAITISDVSGSMMSGIPNILVSVSIALYFSERNVGPFKDYWINFSSNPSFQKFKGNNIYEKYQNMDKNNWGASTDLQAAFDLILTTAKQNKVLSKDLPSVLIIISDMEFDCACSNKNNTNFDTMRSKYKNNGYELPQVIWWNVAARNDNCPIRVDDNGTSLVSGCSPSIFKHITSGKKYNPMQMIFDTVNTERYARIIT